MNPLTREASEAVQLMERRAALLEGPQQSNLGDGDSAARSSELDEVTVKLKELLARGTSRVRVIRLEEDQDLALRLAAAEVVHPLADLTDHDEVLTRFADDRRCIVLEHDLLPGHPTNVVWIALTVGTPSSISYLVSPDRTTIDPSRADTAVFYSIWNIEAGLVGIPGGSALIRLASDHLRRQFPSLGTFVTLSPVPGFRQWTESAEGTAELARSTEVGANRSNPAQLSDSALARLCAAYLTSQKSPGSPIDSVARFHMRNGARLWRINAGADPSPRGMDRSFGLMANYRYSPEDLELNRRALADGMPALGQEVEKLRS